MVLFVVVRSGGLPAALVLLALVAATALSGCIAGGDAIPDVAKGEEAMLFEWFPTDSSYAYLLRFQVGGDARCTITGAAEGTLGDKSGLGSYTAISLESAEASWFDSSASRSEDSAHVAGVNTAHTTGPVISNLLNLAYGSSWGFDASNGTSGYVMNFDSGLDPGAPENYLRVACTGKGASIRFYLADAFVPILSSTATGGIGMSSDLVEPLDVNLNDRYALETQGDEVLLSIRSSPRASALQPLAEGSVRIRSPSGEETVDLEPDPLARFIERRHWNEPGAYELILDRVAYGRTPLIGFLGGFVLQQELGA